MSEHESNIFKGARPVMPVVTRPTNARLIDPFANRYGWLALHGIDLRFLSGVDFVGEYYDEDGRQMIPAKRLIPFVKQEAFAANEVWAVAISAGQENDKIMDGYEASMLSDKPRAAYRTTKNSPAYQAYMLMRNYESRGMCLFEEGAGQSFDEMEHFFNLVLRADAPELEPTFREVCERRFPKTGKTVFLSQIRLFLQRYKQSDVLAHVHSGDLDRKIAGSMYTEMRAAVTRGWSYANATLNSTEAGIRKFQNGHKGKEWYDPGDERFADAPPPQDLLFLAETGRTPIDRQGLNEANALAASSQQTMLQGMEMIAEKIGQNQQPQPAGVSMQDVEKMLAASDVKWSARIEAILAAQQPDAPPQDAAQPEDQSATTGEAAPGTVPE